MSSLGRLPEDYYFLPINSGITGNQCVHPCTLRTQDSRPAASGVFGVSPGTWGGHPGSWGGDHEDQDTILTAPSEVVGSFSEQNDKVIVIHEHHHHHHHKNVTEDGEEIKEDKPAQLMEYETRNEASESQQHVSKEKIMPQHSKTRKSEAFKHFFRRFYETLRKRAKYEQMKPEIKAHKKEVPNGDFDDEQEFKTIEVHMMETNPFLEEGFEPIMEYELD